jgi:phosphate transport system substrate-binding protein
LDKTVKGLKVNGVYPSNKTIASGTYPIARPLFMFTNGYPKMGSVVHQFVTLYLTQKGQEIVKRIGFVPCTNY